MSTSEDKELKNVADEAFGGSAPPTTKPPKKAVGKKAPKAKAKAAKKAAPKKVVVKAKKNGAQIGKLSEMNVGSTRLRLFKALHKFPAGLTAVQVKEKTGILPVSGHLAVLLKEELESKRVKREQHDVNGTDLFVYKLTAAGQKALKEGSVDSRKAGNRIGKKWTKARLDFEGIAQKVAKAVVTKKKARVKAKK